jgi:hypothetical protein
MRKLLTFFKTQNPRRTGRGSAVAWLEASSEAARCHAKDPRNLSAASRFLQAYSLSKNFVLYRPRVLTAVASIAFAVCSPSWAQGFNGGGMNLGLGPFTPNPTASFVSTFGNQSSGSGTATYTYTSVNIGNPAFIGTLTYWLSQWRLREMVVDWLCRAVAVISPLQ